MISIEEIQEDQIKWQSILQQIFSQCVFELLSSYLFLLHVMIQIYGALTPQVESNRALVTNLVGVKSM